MFRCPLPITLRLEPGQTLALRHGSNARIAVRAGVLHLTRRDDAEDHFLAPGEAMDLCGSREVVVEAAVGRSAGPPEPGGSGAAVRLPERLRRAASHRPTAGSAAAAG